ncbi:hypothetical protein HF086_016816 [Spodoptera exigua]|uniref:UBA domain-containing protein n=1 Tax=Spodoptera exigua TaxID=7107 RepID=A0A922SI15_SPOEX|nr:hypothetical protein HF086_016816 [Spodoptera exigua]
MELGWSRGAARTGLRAAAGDVDAAHHYLAHRKAQRDRARDAHRSDRYASVTYSNTFLFSFSFKKSLLERDVTDNEEGG